MLKHLLATTALVVAFSAPGYAQQQQDQQPMQPATGQEATQAQTGQETGAVTAAPAPWPVCCC